MPIELLVAIIGLCGTVGAVALAHFLSRRAKKMERRRAAKTELLLALDRWWNSLKEYETSVGEMGSASDHGVVPTDTQMATCLEDFRVVMMKMWPRLEPRSKRVVAEVEQVFLAFVTRAYSSVYGHEVYGDEVPEAILADDRIRQIMGNAIAGRDLSTFSDCAEAYEKARKFLEQ